MLLQASLNFPVMFNLGSMRVPIVLCQYFFLGVRFGNSARLFLRYKGNRMGSAVPIEILWENKKHA